MTTGFAKMVDPREPQKKEPIVVAGMYGASGLT
jgi:hypothetical protein